MIGVGLCECNTTWKAVSGPPAPASEAAKIPEVPGSVFCNAVVERPGDNFFSVTKVLNPTWECAAVKILSNASGHKIVALSEKWLGKKAGGVRRAKTFSTQDFTFPVANLDGSLNPLPMSRSDRVAGAPEGPIPSGGMCAVLWYLSDVPACPCVRNGAVLMSHDQLRTIIKRYTPTMLDVVAPASAEEIGRLEALAGPLTDGYRDFLAWMGNSCPFLDGEELAYSPKDMLELAYEDAEIEIPYGYLLIGIDKTGGCYDVHIQRQDGSVVRLTEFFDGVTNKDMLIENASLTSYLLTTYVRKTLAPSHPFHFAAGFNGDDEQIQELWRRVDEACSHFAIPFRIDYPDFRFYGGNDFVVGVHQRPASSVVNLHFGAIERSRYEPWYDLVFARWRSLRMPV
ncbi:MAG TPA: SMI1/KNR4 family protein [Planctomycetaceae bacterium]|nr:SMI1/KNR4 family protein [Planctomycetaceae bacterium]